MVLPSGGRIGGRVASAGIQKAVKPITNYLTPILGVAIDKTVSSLTNNKSKTNNITKTSNVNNKNFGFGVSFNYNKTTNNNTNYFKAPDFTVNFDNAFDFAVNNSINNAIYNVAAYNVKNIVTGNIQTHGDVYAMYHNSSSNKQTSITKFSNTKQSGGNLGKSITDVYTQINY